MLINMLKLDNIIVQEIDRHDRRSWSLAVISSTDAPITELTFRVHGILSKIDLVPGDIAKYSTY